MGAQAQRTEVQRTRGPNLAVLVAYANKVPSEEGLRLANEGNLVVASNKRLDKALVGSDEWQQPNVRPALPAWTGTYAGYEEVGKKLGKTIEYVDPETGIRHVFPVPEQYQGPGVRRDAGADATTRPRRGRVHHCVRPRRHQAHARRAAARSAR